MRWMLLTLAIASLVVGSAYPEWEVIRQDDFTRNDGIEGDLMFVKALDLKTVVAAGGNGLILRSTDGGETWDILSNEHTTTTNPSGNSYGPALTGLSGGGERAEWSLEAFDLSPYAGREVLVRFEVVTDEALNHPGLVVDDISIPELGYADDVEEGAGGWQAAGWLRVTDHVPQEFVVQLITLGDGTLVERMPLDEENRGRLILRGLGRQIDRAVLVVSALGKATTEPAVYSYRITVEE